MRPRVGHALAVLLLALSAGAQDQAPTEQAVDRAIMLAQQYLVASVLDDGRMVYLRNMDPDVRVDEQYNILRHAGAIMAMAQAYERRADPPLLDAMRRAAGFLKTRIEPMGEQFPGVLTIWSPHGLNDLVGEPNEAKLGGSALALIALCALERHAPGTTDHQTLQGLAEFLLLLQKDDGSFYPAFLAEKNKPDKSWESLYYPGEASLGLVMLYEVDGDARWLQAAADAMHYLARDRKGDWHVPDDHWAMLATARLFAHLPHEQVAVDRDALARHVQQVCQSMANDAVVNARDADLIGALEKRGLTTPTSTRLEGLIAAAPLLADSDPDLHQLVLDTIDAGIAFLLRAQVAEGEFAGAFPHGIKRFPRHPQVSARFNLRVTEVRIDYVQHALSAMIAYEQLRD